LGYPVIKLHDDSGGHPVNRVYPVNLPPLHDEPSMCMPSPFERRRAMTLSFDLLTSIIYLICLTLFSSAPTLGIWWHLSYSLWKLCT